MKYLLFLLLPFGVLIGESSFITKTEYAEQLYKNPRGIGCGHCHGSHGEGRVIAHYVHKNRQRSFVGPKINDTTFGDFYQALIKPRKGMPRYYLTQREIETLYFYLHQNDKKKRKK